MITIKDFINKIKWDKRENPEDYSLFYVDRISKELIEIKMKDIKKIEDCFLSINKDEEEINIPLHRIREVRKKDVVVWKR